MGHVPRASRNMWPAGPPRRLIRLATGTGSAPKAVVCFGDETYIDWVRYWVCFGGFQAPGSTTRWFTSYRFGTIRNSSAIRGRCFTGRASVGCLGFIPDAAALRDRYARIEKSISANANLSQTDPIHRGYYIISRVLCRSPTDIIDVRQRPPERQPGTTERPPERQPGTTERMWVEQLTSDPACAACHAKLIDPLGFAFENFDAIGRERELENGIPIDSTRAFTFSDGKKMFTGAEELVNLLAEEPAAHQCYSARLAEFVLARDLHEEDKDVVADVQSQSLKDNASVQQIALAVILSPSFTDAHRAD